MVRLILEYPPTFPGITGVHYLISRGMFEIILILCNQIISAKNALHVFQRKQIHVTTNKITIAATYFFIDCNTISIKS